MVNWIQALRAKVGLGGWSICWDNEDTMEKIYIWDSAWAAVAYRFVPEGVEREQVKGTHPAYPKVVVHAKGTDKYKQLKCQLLALDDGIYHPPQWWRDKLADHYYGRKRGAKQIENFNLVEKYLNMEV